MTVYFHLGTNDLKEGQTPEEVMDKVKDVVKLTAEKNKECTIILSGVAPRGDDSELDTLRQEFNVMMLKHFQKTRNIICIDNNNLSNRGSIIKSYYAADLIHLTPRGASVLTANFHHILKELFGVSEEYDTKFSRDASPKPAASGRSQPRGRWQRNRYMRQGPWWSNQRP